MRVFLCSVIMGFIFVGCGKGSESPQDIKIRGVSRASIAAPQEGIRSIQFTNVRSHADYQITGDQIQKASAEGKCVSTPEFVVSLADPEPVLLIDTYDSEVPLFYSDDKSIDHLGGLPDSSQLQEIMLGEAQNRSIPLFGATNNRSAPQLERRGTRALKLYSSRNGQYSLEACLLVATRVQMENPILRLDSAPRSLDDRQSGKPPEGIRRFDTLDIFITNPNRVPMNVAFTGFAVDQKEGNPYLICHRLAPVSSSSCTDVANHSKTLSPGESMTVGVTGAYRQNTEGRPWEGRFRTIAIQVNWSISADIPEVGNYQSSQVTQLY